MTKPELGPAPKTRMIPEPEILNDDKLVILPDRRSMWSCAINNALEKAGGEIGKYRFMGVSLVINGRDILLAQGIWNEVEANKVKDGIKDNKPKTDDYSEYELKTGVNRITFTSNTEVINHLIENKTFVKGKNSNDKGPYKLTYYPIFGQIKELPINLDIHLLESSKKGYTFVAMDVSNRK